MNDPAACTLKATPWLVWHKTNPMESPAVLRLFCFHYAGGDALFYRNWADYIPETIDICAIQLPGRGNRRQEPLVSSLAELVGDITRALRLYLDRPFAFFGHSMGALISFEIARELRRSMKVEPAHLFVSGRRAPHLPEETPPIYDLPEIEFIEELRRLNGTPKEVLDHRELMDLVIPLLRADFSICQTYVYRYEPPLSCPISAYGGLQDEDVSPSDLRGWQEQTSSDFKLRMFPGDHFFLKSSQASLLYILTQELYWGPSPG
jgi:medium-chain acyl-[acyl-carrier-protein] hydrolase